MAEDDLLEAVIRDRRRLAPGLWGTSDIDCLLRIIDVLRQAKAERFLLATLQDGGSWDASTKGIYESLKAGYMDCDDTGLQIWLTEAGKRHVERMPKVAEAEPHEKRNEFWQRVCDCGTANHDLRRRCRSCGKEIGEAEPHG